MDHFTDNINRTLLDYALDQRTDFYQKYFVLATHIHKSHEISKFRRDLIDFLHAKLDEKRAVLALDLIHYILGDNDMEDFVPIIRYLTDKEFSGDVHRKYRDHTTHQLLVFLLGSYLYENIPDFKQFYERQHQHEFGENPDQFRTGFFFQWSSISLFHDFGYFFDVDEPLRIPGEPQPQGTDPSNRKRYVIWKFFKELEKYFNTYLEYVYSLEKPDNREADEEKRNRIRRFQNFLVTDVVLDYHDHLDTLLLSDLRFAGGFFISETDCFELLEEFAAELYPRFTGLVKPYFDMLNLRGAPYADPYVKVWDHGIASALLFIKLCCYGFKVYTDIIELSPEFDTVEPDLRDIAQELHTFIVKWDYSRRVFDRLILSSAFVMALHNIRMLNAYPLFNDTKYEPHSVRLLDYIENRILPVRPEDNFLLYLLLLVDQLQEWDRYNIVKTGDQKARETLESHQIGLATEGGSCTLIFSGPEWVKDRAAEIRQDIDKFTISDRPYVTIQDKPY